MKDVPPNYPSRSNLSRRINNPQIYNRNTFTSQENSSNNNFDIKLVDPEAQSKFPDINYVKELTGRIPASLSIFDKSTNTLIKEVSHEFDQFTYVLIGSGVISLIFGFFVLSCM